MASTLRSLSGAAMAAAAMYWLTRRAGGAAAHDFATDSPIRRAIRGRLSNWAVATLVTAFAER